MFEGKLFTTFKVKGHFLSLLEESVIINSKFLYVPIFSVEYSPFTLQEGILS